MPRVTLYVPDDLKAQMDKVGDDLNWSGIAQRAFSEEIRAIAVQRNLTDMTNVIERLRSSKAQFEKTELTSGRECGQTWAKEAADYDELLRVVEAFEAEKLHDFSLRDLKHILDPNDLWDASYESDFVQDHLNGPNSSQAFLRGFARGAVDIYQEVAKHL